MAPWTLPLFSMDKMESRTHVVAVTVTTGRGSRRHHHAPFSSITTIFILIFFISHSSIQTSANDFINDSNNDRGLFPPTFNLASTANITSNATCGENGEETFCKLVEHVRAPQCGVCDAKSWNTSRRHPITNAIDGTNNWWQSPSVQNGRQYEWVTITLDLHQIYQVAYVIIKAANSPRPGNWILERSLDGVTFLPWQYYAINEAECIEIYNIHPTVGIPRYRSDDEVICTAYYSRLEPLENGEIHTSLVKGRPGVSGPTDKLQEFTAARFVRLRLQKVRSLHADLMTLAASGWETVDKTVTRRPTFRNIFRNQLFYSIKDISIGGQCMCFGHAQDCRSDLVNKHLKCHCVHNTCGDSCEKCCPLYNQKPWRLGTSTDAGVCEKCQCYGHAYECRYDKEVATAKKSLNIEGQYEGGGVCVDCRDFTTGINCEQCIDGYYRPIDIPPDASQPCVKCNCSGFGTIGHCIKKIGEGKKLGDCICREGFGGAQCDRCAIGYRNYPVCDLCPCNFAGTLNTDCEGMCICKPNVDGVRCDRCKPGHFNLDATNSKGCRKCYCSGATSRCVSADMGIEVVTTRDGWQVSDAMGQKIIRPTSEGSSWAVASDEMTDHEAYFWLAPEEFTGNKLNTYGGEIRYNLSWVKARGDSAGYLTSGPAIVIDGGGMMIAYWGNDIVHKGSEVIVDILLTESGWTHFSPDQVVHPKKTKLKKQQAVSRKTFMEVLVMLDRFLIQAKYHTDQIVGKLNSVSIEMGSAEANTVRRLKNIEKCQCPIGYAGLSCESCERGYRRVNNSAHGGKCEKCDCYDHVDSCDPYTGACHDCLHHTTGDKCQQCKAGYYGVATNGSPDDCKQCVCLLEDPTNAWNLLCTTVVVNSTFIDYVCEDCPVGYSGSKCEICDKGYFGNPMTPVNYCQPCNCYGYNNESIRCDSLTGQCLDCPGNREGWHCDLCKDGYWGDPLVSDCQACKCDPFGSIESSTCDKKTGQCQCRPLYVGMRCDRCTDNYGNVEAGCNICDCNEIGSESPTCDPISGQCQCKAGVFGTKCDACLDGYYGFSLLGCTYCNCNSKGAVSTVCDTESGQCFCANHATGRQCSECEQGFWNLTPEKGCGPCQCNSVGSVDNFCNSVTGQCLCREGVGSTDCSKCLPGFYGFSRSGCQKCDDCDIPGHLCDPLTGDCVCPPLTTGDYCERCEKNSWRFDSELGCQDCNCSSDGSTMSQCDVESGECECSEGYEGRQCNRCRFGYFDFLKCKRCKCHLDGTDPTKCRLDGHCECSEDGQCPCKINVEGKKCRRCRAGTFGRTPIQVEGCTPCFCFGKSSRCRQAELTWTRLAHLDSRKAGAVDQAQSVYIIHGLRVIPGVIGDVEVSSPAHINAPLYWKLPDTLQGDLVASYNGRLVFRMGSEGGEYFPPSVLNTYPIVLLQGNHRIILEYYPETRSTDGWFDVHLHESRWKFKNNPDIPVDRPTMLVALQRVQHILIRATDRTDFTLAWLTNVSIDTLASSQKSFSSVMAIGIEICQCPIQYNGTSCQDPADGYYRFKKNNSLDSKDILDLVGISLPCPCNGRSRKCDKETGICRDCQFNTSGNNCERCADGFYGNPSVAPCQPCACPTVGNSFSEHCALIDSTLTCTHCREGHYGNQCEFCVDGYYGDPFSSEGKCLPCNCNNRGSMGNFCNKETGQCLCLDGLSGRDCSICPYRHVLMDYGCQTCDDECTGLQLSELDDLHKTISTLNLSGINPVPWNKLSSFEKNLNLRKRQVEFYQQSLSDGQLLIKDFESTFNLEERADKQMLKLLELQRNSSLTCNNAVTTNTNAEMFLKQSWSIQQLIAETVRRLKDYASGIDKVSVQLGDAVFEAEKFLDEILEVSFSSKDEESQKEFRKAKALIDRVRKLIFDPQRMKVLEKNLTRLEEKFNDVLSYIPTNIGIIQMQVTDLKLHINRSKEGLARAEELISESKIIMDDSSILIANSEELVKQAKNNLKVLEDVLLQLENSYSNLTARNRNLALKLPEASKRVNSARAHANELEKIALNLARLFNSTLNESTMALKAATAYKNVIAKLNSALEIARMALELAMRNLNEVKPEDMLSYSENAMSVLKFSKELFRQASDIESIRWKDLKSQWETLDGKAKIINSTINSNNKILGVVISDIDELEASPNNFHERIDAIINQSGRAKKLANEVKNNLKTTTAKVNDISEKAKMLGLASNDPRNITTKVNKVVEDISRWSATTANDWSKRLEKGNLQNHFQNMKRDIAGFRQSSGNWLIGLKGDGNCKRELRHDVHSVSFSNIISFNYAITTNHSNSLLFYLGDPDMGEFLAMEMVNRTMRFVWDSGGGRVTIDYPKLPIKNLDINFDKNSEHYQIEAVRNGNKGSLKMKDQTNKEWLEPVTKEFNSDHNVINFGPQTRFLIGSLPKANKVDFLSSTEFYGCLSNFKLNNENIGLWNFVSNDKCLGCKADSVSSSEYGFHGNGYIKGIRRSRRGSKDFGVYIKFRTFNEYSLLFFASDQNEVDFFAVYISAGHVYLKIRSSDEILQLRTNYTYNDNHLINIEARQQSNQVFMRVTRVVKGKHDPEQFVNLLPGNQKTLSLTNRPFYIGGLPRTINLTNFINTGISFQSFYGCLSIIVGTTLISQTTRQSNDFQNVTFFGVTLQCPSMLANRLVIGQNGYLEIDSFPLIADSNIGFTIQPVDQSSKDDKLNAMLLLSTYISDSMDTEFKEDFYSLVLKDGELIFNCTGAISSIKHLNRFKANEIQHILIKRLKRSIEIRVNDYLIQNVTLSSNRILNGSRLFLGGVKSSVAENAIRRGQIEVSKSFEGVINDVTFNFEPAKLNVYKTRLNVTQGDASLQPEVVKKNMKNVSKRCATKAQFGRVESALKFGDSNNSYASLDLKKNKIKQKYNMSFEFRTHYPDGLLIVLNGEMSVRKSKGQRQPKGKSPNELHLIVYLSNSSIKVSDTTSTNHVSVVGFFHDGQWHKVVIRQNKKKIEVVVDSKKTVSFKSSLTKLRSAAFGNVHTFIKNIRRAQSIASFKGCIRKYEVNNVAHDLSSASVKQNVGICFSNVEAGSWFGGDAYAVYDSSFKVEINIEMKMQFRTTESSGLLISMIEPKGLTGLQLGLLNGNVTMRVILLNGEELNYNVDFGELKNYICDDEWHNVTATYGTTGHISIVVDDQYNSKRANQMLKTQGQLGQGPLYIGGLPDKDFGHRFMRDNFHGCIRNVVIANRIKDWVDMSSLHNVLINSCYLQHNSTP